MAVPERTQQVELGTIEEIKVVDAKTKARNLKFARLRLDDEAAQLRHDVDQLVAGVARVIDQSVVPELLHRLLILVQNPTHHTIDPCRVSTESIERKNSMASGYGAHISDKQRAAAASSDGGWWQKSYSGSVSSIKYLASVWCNTSTCTVARFRVPERS